MPKAVRQIAPATPRFAAASAYSGDWLWFKMREDPGTDTQLVNSSGKVLSAPLTITNAASGDWSSVPRYFTPGAGSGGSTRYARMGDSVDATISAVLKAFFSPTENANGSMIIAWDHIQTRDPAATEYIWAASVNDGTNGGYGIRLATTGHVQLMWGAQAGGGATLRSQYDLGAMPVARTSILTAWDFLNATCHLYVGGVLRDSDTLATPLPVLSTTGGASGFTWFAVSGTAPANYLNGTADPTHAGVSVGDMLMLKCTVDRSADFAALAVDLQNYPRELPMIMADWG